MPLYPQVVYTYQPGMAGSRNLYYSMRTAPGVWTVPTVYGTTRAAGMAYESTSAGVLTDGQPPKRGVIAWDGSETVFLGQGLPNPETPFYSALQNNITNTIPLDMFAFFDDYWHVSRGAWWINSAWYAMLQVFNTGTGLYRYAMLRSVGYAGGDPDQPNQWTEMDQAGSPQTDFNGNIARWDGQSGFLDLLLPRTAAHLTWDLYAYNFTTDTWSAAYGGVAFGGHQMGEGWDSQAGGGIYRYPNGDIGTLYGYLELALPSSYYRLYVAATGAWNPEIVVKDYGGGDFSYVSQVIPDPGKESLHVFTTIDQHFKVAYHVVSHLGVVQADCFLWPPAMISANGPMAGCVYQNQLLTVQGDGNAGEDFNLWVATITGGPTVFVSELIPRPAGVNPLAEAERGAALFWLVAAAAPPAPVAVATPLRSFAIGKPYLKCGNVWDWCLRNDERPWYEVDWASHGCIPVKCWRLEDDPLHAIPEQGREFHKLGTISLPAAPSVDTQIFNFRVPLGYDGIIYSVLCKFVGTGFVNGDGNLLWRFRVNEKWIKSLHSIPTELGDYTGYMQLDEFFRVQSGQTVRAYGWVSPASGIKGGSMIAAVQGWYFPAQFVR